MPELLDVEALVSAYIIPWGINIFLALATFVVGRWIANLLLSLVKRLLSRGKMDEILMNFIVSILNAALLLFIIIASMDQLGVNTTSLIAVLGAAGLAVGLALKDSLQNFAAGVMLIVFCPFRTGDYVEAGGTAGTVETITLFSTVLRTPDNRVVIVPNGLIYGDTITNYSARETRRIDMVFGIGYGDDILAAKELLTGILAADERILADPAPQVAVGELAESSVNFIVRPWVKNSDFWSVKLDLTERIKLAFDAQGISIPYPQMDVHINKSD